MSRKANLTHTFGRLQEKFKADLVSMQKFCIFLGGYRMRNLRQICAATVLTLAFTVSAFAGQISCPGAPAPASNADSNSQGSEAAAPGDMGNGAPTALLIILDLLF
jgi:hypothetical protein